MTIVPLHPHDASHLEVGDVLASGRAATPHGPPRPAGRAAGGEVSSDLDRPARAGQDATPFGKEAGKDARASGNPGRAAQRTRVDDDHTDDAPPDAHTLARMHRAFEFHCRGFRTAPIAEKLGVTARTVRNYLKPYREQISAEHRIDRDMNLMRAIESQRAIAAAA